MYLHITCMLTSIYRQLHTQLELSRANEVARRSEAALKAKEGVKDSLLSNEQQVASSLREALQAKEADLTRTTDQYLQVG